MNITSIYNLEAIYPPKLDYLVITLIILVIGQVLEKNLAKGKRERIASIQRTSYYTRLKEEAARMDEKATLKEQQLSNVIEQLEHEGEELRSQLDDIEISVADEDSDEDATASDASFNDKIDRQKKELADLHNTAKELEIVEESISHLTMNSSIIDAGLKENEALESRISQLEVENHQLKAQIEEFKNDKMNSSSKIPNTKLDSNILSYLEDHKDNLTLDFLKSAQETLLEVKALHPDMNFNDYIKNLKNSQVHYNSTLADLQVSLKESEIKFQLLKKRYEEELSSFDELRVEHIFKNSGAKEYLDRLKDKNKIKEDMVKDLRNELSQRNNEIDKWREKFQNAEDQLSQYWKAWKDTQTKLAQLEMENKASRERDRRHLNIGSPSSMLDNQVPPPPPIEVPSIDEILQADENHSSLFSLGSITPPPQIEPFSSFKYS